jgi:hypothetical protein
MLADAPIKSARQLIRSGAADVPGSTLLDESEIPTATLPGHRGGKRRRRKKQRKQQQQQGEPVERGQRKEGRNRGRNREGEEHRPKRPRKGNKLKLSISWN